MVCAKLVKSPSIARSAVNAFKVLDNNGVPDCARLTMPTKTSKSPTLPVSSSPMTPLPLMSNMPSMISTPSTVPSSLAVIRPSPLMSIKPLIMSYALILFRSINCTVTVSIPWSSGVSKIPSESLSKNTVPAISKTLLRPV